MEQHGIWLIVVQLGAVTTWYDEQGQANHWCCCTAGWSTVRNAGDLQIPEGSG